MSVRVEICIICLSIIMLTNNTINKNYFTSLFTYNLYNNNDINNLISIRLPLVIIIVKNLIYCNYKEFIFIMLYYIFFLQFN